MAWPYTTAHTTFTALLKVGSTFLNSIQAAVIDLFARHDKVELVFVSEEDGAGSKVPAWTGYATVGNGVVCNTANKKAWAIIRGRNGMRLYAVRLKVWNNAAASLSATLYQVDQKYSSSASAPTSTNLAGAAATAAVSYETITLTPAAAPVTLSEGDVFVVEVGAASVDDRVVGVQVETEPLTYS